MFIQVNEHKLLFIHIDLHFLGQEQTNIFRNKNNKTLRETLEHKRYGKFKELCFEKYHEYLEQPLGEFLIELKNNNDKNYKLFLNKYGDLTYSQFRIGDSSIAHQKGLYCYKVDGKIKYVGRCLDDFNKRINHGYGKIHPKNCYLDGQATNCHLNSKITANRDTVDLFVCSLDNDDLIIELENVLIKKYQPKWNISK